MKNRAALIFGYNDYALEIAKNITDEYENVYLYSLNSEQDILKNRSGFKVKSFDLSDRWDDLSDRWDDLSDNID
ncbi:MAG: hypothetical protein AABY36_09840, partial [Campylobacterota bacterium]